MLRSKRVAIHSVLVQPSKYCDVIWCKSVNGNILRLSLSFSRLLRWQDSSPDFWMVLLEASMTICELVSLDPVLKPMYANFLRNAHSHREAGFLFMEWLSNIKKVALAQAHKSDKEMMMMVIVIWMNSPQLAGSMMLMLLLQQATTTATTATTTTTAALTYIGAAVVAVVVVVVVAGKKEYMTTSLCLHVWTSILMRSVEDV
eukprot:5386823-Amphidinium_carterae.1